MGSRKDDEMSQYHDEETQRLMKEANKSLERMRSFTTTWDVLFEGHKDLLTDKGYQVSKTGLQQENDCVRGKLVMDSTKAELDLSQDSLPL